MKLFNLSWQPAQELTTLLLENVALSPTGRSLGAPCYCHLLALNSSVKSLALPSPYLSPGQGEMWVGARVARQAKSHQPWPFPPSPLKEEGEGRLEQTRTALSMCAVLLRLA